MKILVTGSFIILTGCATPEPVEITVPVDRPVYCAERIEQKEYESERIAENDPVKTKIIKLLIDRRQRIDTELQLRAELKGCQKPEED